MNKQFYVYIATNKGNSVLYTGITNDLSRRMFEHKNKVAKGFTEACWRTQDDAIEVIIKKYLFK